MPLLSYMLSWQVHLPHRRAVRLRLGARPRCPRLRCRFPTLSHLPVRVSSPAHSRLQQHFSRLFPSGVVNCVPALLRRFFELPVSITNRVHNVTPKRGKAREREGGEGGVGEGDNVQRSSLPRTAELAAIFSSDRGQTPMQMHVPQHSTERKQ